MIKNFKEFKKHLNESNVVVKSKILEILKEKYPKINDAFLTELEECFSLCKDAAANKEISMKENQINRINKLLNIIDQPKVHYFYSLKMMFYIELFNLNKSIKMKMLAKRLDGIFLKIKELNIDELLLKSNTFIEFISELDNKIEFNKNEYYYFYKDLKKYDGNLPMIFFGCLFDQQENNYYLIKYYIVDDETNHSILYMKFSEKDYTKNKDNILKHFKYIGEYDDILGTDHEIRGNIPKLAKEEYS